MKLTVKREEFAKKYVECGNASAAYRFAFACEKSSNKTVWENASRLLADSNVASRVAELRESTQKSFEVKFEDILRKLAEIAGLTKPVNGLVDPSKSNTRDRIAAIAEMNRMLGYNAPQKMAQTTADGKDVIIAPEVIVVMPDGERIKVSDESI